MQVPSRSNLSARARAALLHPAVLGVALAVGCSAAALAFGSTSGELGSRGKARGDLSKEAGEFDEIGLDLVAGQTLDLKLSCDFVATLEIRDPGGDLMDLALTPGKNLNIADWMVTEPGHYVASIASADGSQGLYKLTAAAGYSKKVDVATDDETTFDVWLPTGGRLTGKFRGGSGDPYIGGVLDPDGNEVVGRIDGKRRRVKLSQFTATAAGRYQVTVGGMGGASGKLVRKTKKASKTNLKLTNGLTPISYADDGVDALFRNRCADCHSWAASYVGVRKYGRSALGRMRTGNMPKGDGRVGGDDLSLVDQWLRTGMQR